MSGIKCPTCQAPLLLGPDGPMHESQSAARVCGAAFEWRWKQGS